MDHIQCIHSGQYNTDPSQYSEHDIIFCNSGTKDAVEHQKLPDKCICQWQAEYWPMQQ